jgi:hypothetical protein
MKVILFLNIPKQIFISRPGDPEMIGFYNKYLIVSIICIHLHIFPPLEIYIINSILFFFKPINLGMFREGNISLLKI